MQLFNKIKNLLQYTITSGRQYNGGEYEGGYHTLEIQGKTIEGQRKPSYRLEKVNYDFTGKTVLDIGANQGGMLFELQNKLKQGVGVDFDHRLMNVANRIARAEKYNNLGFYVFDAEKENHDLLNNFVDQKIDVVFLLAVCMWIENWQDLVKWVHANSSYCLFETNGKKHDQQAQLDLLNALYTNVTVLRESSEDDPKQKKRITVWCEK